VCVCVWIFFELVDSSKILTEAQASGLALISHTASTDVFDDASIVTANDRIPTMDEHFLFLIFFCLLFDTRFCCCCCTVVSKVSSTETFSHVYSVIYVPENTTCMISCAQLS